MSHKRAIFLAAKTKTTRRPVVLRYMLTAAPQVDREAGIIRNVAVITAGVTKPSGDGQGPIDVDATTLQQVMQAINSRQIGVKSRITHPELEPADGFLIDELPRRLGYIFNGRIDGNCVRADMQFHDPKSTHALTLMDIAERDPASCGLSIVDDLATIEPSPTAQTGFVLRIEKLDAVDWVGTPAANPAGMLSAKRRHIRLTQESLMFNEAQLAKLAEFGLTEGADPQAFYDSLTAEQKAEVDALASSATDTPAEATMRRKLSARARITNKAAIRLAKARLEGEEPKTEDEEGAKLNAGLNEAQLAYLVSVGLPADADADAVAAFITTLTPEQLAELDALATPVEPAATMRGSKKNAPADDNKEPVTAAAAKSAVKDAIKAQVIDAAEAEQRRRDKELAEKRAEAERETLDEERRKTEEAELTRLQQNERLRSQILQERLSQAGKEVGARTEAIRQQAQEQIDALIAAGNKAGADLAAQLRDLQIAGLKQERRTGQVRDGSRDRLAATDGRGQRDNKVRVEQQDKVVATLESIDRKIGTAGHFK